VCRQVYFATPSVEGSHTGLALAPARSAKRYQLSFYDAHICAAAVLSGAKTLLCGDMQSGMKIDGLVVNNPFI
jgi:predicted nucleic acid-binding protein